ncbi:ABC transporter ATP-binding protein [Corynebacterium sp.]|uniref:ABC transporter ATP-binding protein n=1 Tax=Corynebacterium sp. TaxID=1720 RepID=UPI0028AE04C6|nr:ABC transporter ATP-binding protein [Corynebacterium sp.]
MTLVNPAVSAEDPVYDWGLGQAPDNPTPPRILFDPIWTPRQLSFALIRANAKRLSAASLLLITFGICNMLMPAVVGRVVGDVATPAFDGVSFEDFSADLYLWLGALAVLYVVMHFGFQIGGRTGWLAVQRSQYELSQAVIERILSSRGFAGAQRAPGQLLSIATGDTQRTSQVFYIIVYPPSQVAALLVAVITLFIINPWLGLGVVIVLPILLSLMHLAAKPLRARSLKEQHSLADAAGAAADLVSGFRVISGLHAQKTDAANYRTFSQEALRTTISARNARAAFEGVTTTGSQLVAVLVALAAIVMALGGMISAGELITATGVAVIMISPIQELVATLGSMWAISQASSQRVLDLINAGSHPATAGTVELEEDENFIAFEELDLAGHKVDGRIEPDEFVVLNLPQESVTQLTEILTLKRMAEKGTFGIGGFDITALTPQSLHSQLLVLPHHPGLFAGTVLENVQFNGGREVYVHDAREALEVAALGEHELPDGLGAHLGDGALELSGGQRQRIALARAVAANPRILVLVEPTTSVDAVTEEIIAQRLRARREGLLTVAISTSRAFNANADRVITPVKVSAT